MQAKFVRSVSKEIKLTVQINTTVTSRVLKFVEE